MLDLAHAQQGRACSVITHRPARPATSADVPLRAGQATARPLRRMSSYAAGRCTWSPVGRLAVETAAGGDGLGGPLVDASSRATVRPSESHHGQRGRRRLRSRLHVISHTHRVVYRCAREWRVKHGLTGRVRLSN